jgi:hypothetical protein
MSKSYSGDVPGSKLDICLESLQKRPAKIPRKIPCFKGNELIASILEYSRCQYQRTVLVRKERCTVHQTRNQLPFATSQRSKVGQHFLFFYITLSVHFYLLFSFFEKSYELNLIYIKNINIYGT